MSIKNYKPVAESLAFEYLEAGRPEVNCSVDISNEGDPGEHINLSISSQISIELPEGGLTKQVAKQIFQKMGLDPKTMYPVNEGFVIGHLGKTELAEVSLFARNKEIDVTISVDDFSMTDEELAPVPIFEQMKAIHENLVNVCQIMVEDYNDLMNKASSLTVK